MKLEPYITEFEKQFSTYKQFDFLNKKAGQVKAEGDIWRLKHPVQDKYVVVLITIVRGDVIRGVPVVEQTIFGCDKDIVLIHDDTDLGCDLLITAWWEEALHQSYFSEKLGSISSSQLNAVKLLLLYPFLSGIHRKFTDSYKYMHVFEMCEDMHFVELPTLEVEFSYGDRGLHERVITGPIIIDKDDARYRFQTLLKRDYKWVFTSSCEVVDISSKWKKYIQKKEGILEVADSSNVEIVLMYRFSNDDFEMDIQKMGDLFLLTIYTKCEFQVFLNEQHIECEREIDCWERTIELGHLKIIIKDVLYEWSLE